MCHPKCFAAYAVSMKQQGKRRECKPPKFLHGMGEKSNFVKETRTLCGVSEKTTAAFLCCDAGVHETHDLSIDFGQDEISLFQPHVVYDIFVARKLTS